MPRQLPTGTFKIEENPFKDKEEIITYYRITDVDTGKVLGDYFTPEDMPFLKYYKKDE